MKKKLRLDPEALTVEPFEVNARVEEDGTVFGADASDPRNCTAAADSCGYPATCGGTSCPTGYPLCRFCGA